MDDELEQAHDLYKKVTSGPTWRQVGWVVVFLMGITLVAVYLNARSAAHDRAELAGKGCEVDNSQLEFMLGLLNRATTPKLLAPGSPPEAIAQQEADNAEAKRYREEAISKLRARSCSELLKGHLPEPLPIPVPPPLIPPVPEPAKAPIGLTGIQGQQGVEGKPGADGKPGRDGTDGQDGPRGPMGLEGSPGPEGPQGPPGIVLVPPPPEPNPVPTETPPPPPAATAPTVQTCVLGVCLP